MLVHPLRPALETMHSTIGRAVAYVGLWFLGTNFGRYADYALSYLREGSTPLLDDELNGGVLVIALIAHPVGWLILVANVIVCPVFVRFKTSPWWLLLPFLSSLGYTLLLLN